MTGCRGNIIGDIDKDSYFWVANANKLRWVYFLYSSKTWMRLPHMFLMPIYTDSPRRVYAPRKDLLNLTQVVFWQSNIHASIINLQLMSSWISLFWTLYGFHRYRVKLLCNILKVLSRGSRVILEEGILEVNIYTIVSVLVFMMCLVMNIIG